MMMMMMILTRTLLYRILASITGRSIHRAFWMAEPLFGNGIGGRRRFLQWEAL